MSVLSQVRPPTGEPYVGRSACPVRREGASKPIDASYPYVRVQACSVQGGANPPQVNLLRPVADRNCVAARRGGEQRKANRVVRSESKLDSAALTGEPAAQRRSLYPCKRESHDAEGLGEKAVMGGSKVIGDRRLWRDRTREARRPAWCKKENGPQGTALRKERYRPRGRASTQESEHSW